MKKLYIIVLQNTGQLLLTERILKDSGILTEIIPLPPRINSGCIRGVGITEIDVEKSVQILSGKNIVPVEIITAENLKVENITDEKNPLSPVKVNS